MLDWTLDFRNMAYSGGWSQENHSDFTGGACRVGRKDPKKNTLEKRQEKCHLSTRELEENGIWMRIK